MPCRKICSLLLAQINSFELGIPITGVIDYVSTDIACTLCRYTEAFVCLENHREMYFPFTMKSQRLKEAIAIFLRLNKKKRRLNFFIRNEKRDRKNQPMTYII